MLAQKRNRIYLSVAQNVVAYRANIQSLTKYVNDRIQKVTVGYVSRRREMSRGYKQQQKQKWREARHATAYN